MSVVDVCCRSSERMAVMPRPICGGGLAMSLSCSPIAAEIHHHHQIQRFGSSIVEIVRTTSSSTSSSIGRNSDGEDEDEIQSSFRSGPLDSMVADFEEAMPIRRGISEFYRGKSKSFTSLQDASACCSAKEIAKPDNAYTRKRKNLNYTLMRGIGGLKNSNDDHIDCDGVSKRSKLTNRRRAGRSERKNVISVLH